MLRTSLVVQWLRKKQTNKQTKQNKTKRIHWLRTHILQGN